MEGWGMRRVFAVILAIVFAVAAFTAGDAIAQPKSAIQLGVGSSQYNGALMSEISGFDVFTLHAGCMYFPGPWAVLLADLSYGLPHEYEYNRDDYSSEFKGKSAYFDLMGGACKHFTDGGFVYASAGLAIGWAEMEYSDSEVDLEIDPGVGFVVGAGLQVPIKNTFMGYAGFRQRYLPSELKTQETTMTLNSGGFEMTAGIAWAFGGK
jgi:hypothetical protein